MTKKEAIEKTVKMLRIIDDLPDNVTILSTEVHDDSYGLNEFYLVLDSGIEEVAEKNKCQIEQVGGELYIHMLVHCDGCDYYQMILAKKDG